VEVEAQALASEVQSPEAASHRWASGRPLVGLVATNYIQVIVEQIRYTSCVLQNKLQNVTSAYREKSLILGLEVCIILVSLLLVLGLLPLVLRLLPLVLQLFPQD
jgi:tetrahydromethanopterin S-methyltransferase subunit F